MPGRGRGMSGCISPGEELRRPGHPGKCEEYGEHESEQDGGQQEETEEDHRHRILLDRIFAILSPDDLEVQDVSKEIKGTVNQQNHLEWMVSNLCERALVERTFTPVAAKLLGLTAHHQAGSVKVVRLLMTHLQVQFDKKDELLAKDRRGLVTAALFLGEAYHYVKTEKDSPYNVLAEPALTYLDMIIQPHLINPEQEDRDEEMLVVAKLLLQNGTTLHEARAGAIQSLVQGVTEVLCCRDLRVGTRLNLLAALADLWPCLATANVNMRIQHASLAAKLGVCLNV
ncbi:hypothetical protein Pmani_016788 [Petrolisthes manimaculis]|uniref:Uncharacterized protein n=1 Tax=Petrolisthes manimaculis TaxID=1843537 RepID=A0AAE1U6D1_9EUCA|nr:hypothetical protein Pmani_016788 [Petrolisthes manimaculis]